MDEPLQLVEGRDATVEADRPAKDRLRGWGPIAVWAVPSSDLLLAANLITQQPAVGRTS